MKKIFFLVLISLLAPHLSAQTPNRTVKLSSTNWISINKTTIADALSGFSSGTIWVAAGIYTENELIIPTGVTVIGGFPSTATSLSDRIYPGVATSAQLSILDGKYSHRVTTVAGTLDGFVITKGYVYDASNQSLPMNGNGGGVLINGGTVQNCILHDNIAAKLAPTPGSIPGTYVASVGDIYCTDGTILKPTYTIDNNGNYVATFPSGYSLKTDSIITPNGTKAPLGIVFYVNSAATTTNFLIMGKPGSSRLIWSNPTQNIENLIDIKSLADAKTNMEGGTNTQAINTYITSNSIPINKYPTLQYVNNYPKLGTNVYWYIPASGEMLKIWDVYPQMDACAYLLNWRSSNQSNTTWFPSYPYWTSTEYDKDNVWILYANSYPSNPATLNAPSGDANKTAQNWVFPVASIKL